MYGKSKARQNSISENTTESLSTLLYTALSTATNNAKECFLNTIACSLLFNGSRRRISDIACTSVPARVGSIAGHLGSSGSRNLGHIVQCVIDIFELSTDRFAQIFVALNNDFGLNSDHANITEIFSFWDSKIDCSL